MNGRRAKALRRAIYRDQVTGPKGRRYAGAEREISWRDPENNEVARQLVPHSGEAIVADPRRHLHQQAKRTHALGDQLLNLASRMPTSEPPEATR